MFFWFDALFVNVWREVFFIDHYSKNSWRLWLFFFKQCIRVNYQFMSEMKQILEAYFSLVLYEWYELFFVWFEGKNFTLSHISSADTRLVGQKTQPSCWVKSYKKLFWKKNDRCSKLESNNKERVTERKKVLLCSRWKSNKADGKLMNNSVDISFTFILIFGTVWCRGNIRIKLEYYNESLL